LFDGLPYGGGYRPTLDPTAAAKVARDDHRSPNPFPFGFPDAAPAAGGSFGGLGHGLELLGALALLSLLWRAGGAARSPPTSFMLASIPRPVLELPG
jgi:hypothetical protein